MGGSSLGSIRLGVQGESSYLSSIQELGPEEKSRTLFLSEARLATLAQGFTLSGELHKRASGRYRKVDAVIDGTVLCCTDCKGGPFFVLRLNDVAELVINRAKRKFTLFDKKVERSKAHHFRVSTGPDFERWVSGLEQWLALLSAAREAETEERAAGRMQRIRRERTKSGNLRAHQASSVAGAPAGAPAQAPPGGSAPTSTPNSSVEVSIEEVTFERAREAGGVTPSSSPPRSPDKFKRLNLSLVKRSRSRTLPGPDLDLNKGYCLVRI
jgi:hypothetical protein